MMGTIIGTKAVLKAGRGCCWTCRWGWAETEGGEIIDTACDNPDIPPEDFDDCEANGWDIARPACPFWEEKAGGQE